MKKASYLILSSVLIFSLLILISCTPTPKLSPMQIRQITTRMYECDYETCYRATLTCLQDQEYVIKNTDMESGHILASVDRQTKGGSQFLQALFTGYVSDKGTEYELSAMVDKLSETATEVRINIEKVKYGQSSKFSGTGKQSSKRVYDAKLFQDLFNDIGVEIKRREAMRK
jgi:hypothetical protein